MPQHASPFIFDVVQEAFEREVLVRSHDVPIVVDFWAEWCGPCRLLAPLLEKLAIEYDGKFLLAKARVEDVPDVSMTFGVSSIPAVFALRGGKIVDQFVGVLPEPQLRVWLDALQPSRAEVLAAEAKAMSVANPAAAEAKLREAIELDPRNAAVQIALAQLLLDAGRLDDARIAIEALAARGYLEPEAERVRASLSLKQSADSSGGIEGIRARAAGAPKDFALQGQLAQALAAAGQYDEALDLCLDLVRKDRKGAGEAARQTMIDVFQVLGNDDERTSAYRRKLSSALY